MATQATSGEVVRSHGEEGDEDVNKDEVREADN